jgi:hypothetical protein
MGLAVTITLLASTHTYAQTKSNSANTLKVSPVRSDIQAKPGEVVEVPTTITNLTGAEITVRPIENDFVAGDESGAPALILKEGEYAPTHSLKRFMTPLDVITIPAGKAKTVKVVITVPQTAQAGGYFGAIRFAPSSPDGGGQVNLSGSVASLILLKVPGDITEKLTLTDFAIIQGSKKGTYFTTANDLSTTFRFENKGNVQTGPFGKISVKQGDKVVYAVDFNNKTPRDVILPDSARRWDIPLKNIGSFGHYTVNATFTYGDKNQTIEVVKSFWVVPMGVIIATIVGILIIIALAVGIWLFLRNYKRRILKSQSRSRH